MITIQNTPPPNMLPKEEANEDTQPESWLDLSAWVFATPISELCWYFPQV